MRTIKNEKRRKREREKIEISKRKQWKQTVYRVNILNWNALRNGPTKPVRECQRTFSEWSVMHLFSMVLTIKCNRNGIAEKKDTRKLHSAGLLYSTHEGEIWTIFIVCIHVCLPFVDIWYVGNCRAVHAATAATYFCVHVRRTTYIRWMRYLRFLWRQRASSLSNRCIVHLRIFSHGHGTLTKMTKNHDLMQTIAQLEYNGISSWTSTVRFLDDFKFFAQTNHIIRISRTYLCIYEAIWQFEWVIFRQQSFASDVREMNLHFHCVAIREK